MGVLDESAEHILIDYYGFRNVDMLKRIEGVGPNMNLMVHADFGRYILQYSLVELKEARKKVEFINFMKKNKIPVNEIISDCCGNQIVASNAGSWILKKYINGETFIMNSCKQAKMAADMLARIHLIPTENYQYSFASDHDPYHWLLDMDGEFRLLENEVPNNAILSGIRRTLDIIGKSYTLEEYVKLPRSVVHGDFHGRNLLFEEDKISGVLDFDTAGISARIIDVAEAAFLMGRKSHAGYELNKEVFSEFLKSYGEHIKLTDKEIKAAGMILKLRMIPRARYISLLKKKSFLDAEDQILWSIRMIEAVDKYFNI